MNDLSESGRRTFLRRSFALVPAASALTVTGMVTVLPSSSTAAGNDGALANQPYSPAYFHADEWAFIKAAVARLIPADESGPGAIEAGVPEFIDRQMEGAFGQAANWYMQGPFIAGSPLFGYQGKMLPREVYRAGIAAADAWCRREKANRTFAQLAGGEQDELLKAMETGSVTFDDVNAKDFFNFLLQNTKEGFFSDPIHGGNRGAVAWKMIGFPGARADYLDWVGKPGVRYPLPVVTINGPQG